MINLFSIIIIVLVIGLFGALIYLIYLPIKKRLRNSGKLTDKLNRQINWIFIILLCLVGILAYCYKDYRTPSKDRLEKIANITLPSDFKVIKDEYQDMCPGYCVLYDIQFDNMSTTELITSIRTSKFYNTSSFHNGIWKETDFVKVDTVKGVWAKSPMGYDFCRRDGWTLYSIELDTTTKTLKYNECND